MNSSLQTPYYLANTNSTNHSNLNSSSLQARTNLNTLAKGSQSTVMAGKGPQTLLLTTKDGQVVVQQQQPTVSVGDCNVTTAVGGQATNHTLNSLNSSGHHPQVITINRPLTHHPNNANVTSHPQQILVSNTQGVLPANMVLNMNTSRPVQSNYVNAAHVNNQAHQRGGLAPRFVLNSPIRLAPTTQLQMQRAPGTQNLLQPVCSIFY